MKKLTTLFMLMLLAATPLIFTACDDDDEDIAYTLNSDGRDYWRGNLRIQYDGPGSTSYQTTYSEVEFIKNDNKWAKGHGYWVDYFSDAPWDYQAFHITWKVRDEIIYIYFEEDHSSIEIRDYRLSDRFFEGDIYMRNKTAHFKFERRRWSNYHDSFEYWDHGWYNDNDYDHWGSYSKSNGESKTPEGPFVRSLAVE